MMGKGVSVSSLTLAGRALTLSAVPLGKEAGAGGVAVDRGTWRQRGHQSVSRPDQNVVPMMGEGVSVSLLTLAGRALASSAVPLGKVTGEGMVPEWENGMAYTSNIYIYIYIYIYTCIYK